MELHGEMFAGIAREEWLHGVVYALCGVHVLVLEGRGFVGDKFTVLIFISGLSLV